MKIQVMVYVKGKPQAIVRRLYGCPMMSFMHACLVVSLIVISVQPVVAHADLLQDATAAVDSQQFDRAEPMLRDWLNVHASDNEARLLLGKVLMRQGRHAEALTEYDALLQKLPGNPVYLLAKAKTLIAAGKPQEALLSLEAARSVKPDDEELQQLQFIALRQSGGKKSSQQAAVIQGDGKLQLPGLKRDELADGGRHAATEMRAEGSQEKLALQLTMEIASLPESGPIVMEAQPTPATLPPMPQPQTTQPIPQEAAAAVTSSSTPYTEMEVGYAYDQFDTYFDPWQAGYVSASRQFSETSNAYSTYRQTNRYGLIDHELWAGYFASPFAHWSTQIEGSVSPTHLVLPRWSLYGKLGYAFDNGIGTGIGVRHTAYEAAGTNAAGFILDHYFGKFHAGVSIWESRLDIGGAWVENTQLLAEYFYGERNYVGLYLAAGNEVFVGWDLSPFIAGSVSWTASGTHWVSKNWAAIYSFVQYAQEDWYIRRGINLGVRHRF